MNEWKVDYLIAALTIRLQRRRDVEASTFLGIKKQSAENRVCSHKAYPLVRDPPSLLCVEISHKLRPSFFPTIASSILCERADDMVTTLERSPYGFQWNAHFGLRIKVASTPR